MKIKKDITFGFLFLFFLFLIPKDVFAYSYVKDSCLDTGDCILACNYTVTYKTDSASTGTRNISLYYYHSKEWKLMWESTATSRYVHTKKGNLDKIFSKSGENVYTSVPITLSNFTCPTYGYLDLSDLNGNNELCFDNDGKTCADDYSNIGTSFGKDKSKFKSSVKDYDVVSDLSHYFASWSFGDISCEDMVAKADTLPTEITNKLQKDVSTNFLKGHDVPVFLIHSSAYKNATSTAMASFEAKRKQCKESIDNNDNLTEEEKEEQKDALDNIDEEELESGIKAALDEMEQKVSLENLNRKQTCEGVFGVTEDGVFQEESFGWLLQKLLNYIKIAGPILVILFSMFEFAKAIVSSDDDAMKKAQSRLVIRLIAVLALFLLPFIVGEALKLINGMSNPTCYFK